VTYLLEPQLSVEGAHQGHAAPRTHLVADNMSAFPVVERNN
jgi:hypothetical protein